MEILEKKMEITLMGYIGFRLQVACYNIWGFLLLGAPFDIKANIGVI